MLTCCRDHLDGRVTTTSHSDEMFSPLKLSATLLVFAQVVAVYASSSSSLSAAAAGGDFDFAVPGILSPCTG